ADCGSGFGARGRVSHPHRAGPVPAAIGVPQEHHRRPGRHQRGVLEHRKEMTWSIVAHEPAIGAFAVAVATRAFAVGANCPFVRAGVGAVSTQSLTNRYLGPAVLDLLQQGLAPSAAIERALARDE